MVIIERTACSIDVCVDCLVVLAGDPADDPTGEAVKAGERMTQIWGDKEITPGRLTDDCQHDLDDTDDDAIHRDYCEALGFSYSSCEGCGSSLGGDRYAATVWLVG